jgi:hypothetical protein
LLFRERCRGELDDRCKDLTTALTPLKRLYVDVVEAAAGDIKVTPSSTPIQ